MNTNIFLEGKRSDEKSWQDVFNAFEKHKMSTTGIENILLSSGDIEFVYYIPGIQDDKELPLQIIGRTYLEFINSVKVNEDLVKEATKIKTYSGAALATFDEDFKFDIKSGAIPFAIICKGKTYFVTKDVAINLTKEFGIVNFELPFRKNDLAFLYTRMHAANKMICFNIEHRSGKKVIIGFTISAKNTFDTCLADIKALHNLINIEVSIKDLYLDGQNLRLYLEFPKFSKQGFIYGLEYKYVNDDKRSYLHMTAIDHKHKTQYERALYIYNFKTVDKFSLSTFEEIYNKIPLLNKETLQEWDLDKIFSVLNLNTTLGKKRLSQITFLGFATEYNMVKFLVRLLYELPELKKSTYLRLKDTFGALVKCPDIIKP